MPINIFLAHLSEYVDKWAKRCRGGEEEKEEEKDKEAFGASLAVRFVTSLMKPASEEQFRYEPRGWERADVARPLWLVLYHGMVLVARILDMRSLVDKSDLVGEPTVFCNTIITAVEAT